jgi:hypothetical protein
LVALGTLAGAAAWWWRRSTQVPEPVLQDEPQWPPLTPDTAPAQAPARKKVNGTAPPVAAVAAWVSPANGTCPAGYPVKAARSGVYHLPGGTFYERTTADRCYATAAAAEADGYRASKR